MPRGFAHGDKKTKVIYGMTNVNYEGPQSARESSHTDGSVQQASSDFDATFNSTDQQREEYAAELDQQMEKDIVQGLARAHSTGVVEYYSHGKQFSNAEDMVEDVYQKSLDGDSFLGAELSEASIFIDCGTANPFVAQSNYEEYSESLQKRMPSNQASSISFPLSYLIGDDEETAQLREGINDYAEKISQGVVFNEDRYHQVIDENIDFMVKRGDWTHSNIAGVRDDILGRKVAQGDSAYSKIHPHLFKEFEAECDQYLKDEVFTPDAYREQLKKIVDYPGAWKDHVMLGKAEVTAATDNIYQDKGAGKISLDPIIEKYAGKPSPYPEEPLGF